ncbi:hypothetical protein LOTGIDRAFT_161590 [Lottia gigantea]|uniref:Uncharacterized protein n=1 Tax=Lottia gigantea TaxID=225164 RepID=V4A9R8_LOTGI|nr:hypothetical protein LOTGIDRAFT_161590 [Lottia gigantea]ESO93487.1 hypothetical protein LOTGIDRAFT_161590 [Lottia gigantea]
MGLFRRKKTVVSSLCLGIVVYLVIQVTYFQQEFSPLKVLANAESEAQRLLKFITHYHYQCKDAIYLGNYTAWKICMDPDVGISTDPYISKLSYSLGVDEELGFEEILARNFSFQQFVFLFKPASPLLKKINGTRSFKTIIVPNDPADFGRNSYDTQTLNNIMVNLKHDHLDILKIESLFDMSESHELLYYLVKDKILSKIKQLHILIDIDKIDDDYLYHWYRTLYIVFYEAGLRLYHTGASDSLCLQVTMMESCRYYLSWIRNPGPTVPIMYPPSIDGSYEFEEERLLDYVEEKQQQCDEAYPFPNPQDSIFHVCGSLLRKTSHKICNIHIFSLTPHNLYPSQEFGKCKIHNIIDLNTPSSSQPAEFLLPKHLSKDKNQSAMKEIISRNIKPDEVNIFYISNSDLFWTVLSPILDSGLLQMIDHVSANVDVLKSSNFNPVTLRQRFSELQRLEAFNLSLNEVTSLTERKLYYQSSDSYRVLLSYYKKE